MLQIAPITCFIYGDSEVLLMSIRHIIMLFYGESKTFLLSTLNVSFWRTGPAENYPKIIINPASILYKSIAGL